MTNSAQMVLDSLSNYLNTNMVKIYKTSNRIYDKYGNNLDLLFINSGLGKIVLLLQENESDYQNQDTRFTT